MGGGARAPSGLGTQLHWVRAAQDARLATGVYFVDGRRCCRRLLGWAQFRSGAVLEGGEGSADRVQLHDRTLVQNGWGPPGSKNRGNWLDAL